MESEWAKHGWRRLTNLWRTLCGVEGPDAVSTISCTTAEMTSPPLPVAAFSGGAGGAEHAVTSSTEMARESVWVSSPASDSRGLTLARIEGAASVPPWPFSPTLPISWSCEWRKRRMEEEEDGGEGGWRRRRNMGCRLWCRGKSERVSQPASAACSFGQENINDCCGEAVLQV